VKMRAGHARGPGTDMGHNMARLQEFRFTSAYPQARGPVYSICTPHLFLGGQVGK